MKKFGLYLSVAFGWSWILWVAAILLATGSGHELLENAGLFNSVLDGELTSGMVGFTLIAVLAAFGPMIGGVVVYRLNLVDKEAFRKRFNMTFDKRYIAYVTGILIMITLIPSVPLVIANGFDMKITLSTPFILVGFFLYQLLTSGTEEIGWRGYMLPEMLKTMTPWKASVQLGVIWAFWHTPIVLYIFFRQGMAVPQILSSFVGFVVGTIAMSAFHTYFFVRTRNAVLSMLIHAIGNTVPMLFGFFIGESYVVSVAVQVLMWVVIILMTKRYKSIYDEVQPEFLAG